MYIFKMTISLTLTKSHKPLAKSNDDLKSYNIDRNYHGLPLYKILSESNPCKQA